jgi:hypothetical protein
MLGPPVLHGDPTAVLHCIVSCAGPSVGRDSPTCAVIIGWRRRACAITARRRKANSSRRMQARRDLARSLPVVGFGRRPGFVRPICPVTFGRFVVRRCLGPKRAGPVPRHRTPDSKNLDHRPRSRKASVDFLFWWGEGPMSRPHVRHDFVPLEPAGLQTFIVRHQMPYNWSARLIFRANLSVGRALAI